MIDGMLDLFAGTGVGVAASRLGISEYGVEIMKEAVASRDAAGFVTPYNDAWEIEKAESLSFNTLWASPPCQTFSTAGKGSGRKALDDVLALLHTGAYDRNLKAEASSFDDRTALVLIPLAYISKFRPTYVALEQVPTVLPVWEAYAEKMVEMGYSVWVGYLHAEQYGVPQTRKRAYLIARSDGIEAEPPTPTHSKYHNRTPKRLDAGVQKWVSMAEGLGWGTPERPYLTVASGHMDASFVGGSGARKALEDLATRSSWVFDRPATTIVGSFKPEVVSGPGYRTKGGPSRQNAPGSVCISEQQAAVLQSYPVDFPFQGSKSKRRLQIGNAVPPTVAEAVLRTFHDQS